MIRKYEGGVITSDLVQSSKLSLEEKDKTLQEIIDLANDLLTSRQHVTHVNIFRGDSFQIATRNSFGLLQLSVVIRAYLISNQKDARISLGIGVMDRLPSQDKQSDGEVFILSGHGLDEINNTARRMKLQIGSEMFAFKREHKGISQELENYALVLDDMISGWSSRQAETVFRLIKDVRFRGSYETYNTSYESQKTIAFEMGVTQQTVSKLLKASKWDVVSALIDRYNYISDLFANGVYQNDNPS